MYMYMYVNGENSVEFWSSWAIKIRKGIGCFQYICVYTRSYDMIACIQLHVQYM